MDRFLISNVETINRKVLFQKEKIISLWFLWGFFTRTWRSVDPWSETQSSYPIFEEIRIGPINCLVGPDRFRGPHHLKIPHRLSTSKISSIRRVHTTLMNHNPVEMCFCHFEIRKSKIYIKWCFVLVKSFVKGELTWGLWGFSRQWVGFVKKIKWFLRHFRCYNNRLGFLDFEKSYPESCQTQPTEIPWTIEILAINLIRRWIKENSRIISD